MTVYVPGAVMEALYPESGTVTGFQFAAVCQVPLMPAAHVAVVSICNGPVSVVTVPVRSAAWPSVGPFDSPAHPLAVTMYQLFKLFWVQMTPFVSRARVSPE